MYDFEIVLLATFIVVLLYDNELVLISASWTPFGGHCYVEKKTNIHSILTSKASPVDKVVTFDGPENMSQLSKAYSFIFYN